MYLKSMINATKDMINTKIYLKNLPNVKLLFFSYFTKAFLFDVFCMGFLILYF